jgi:hypothetical protein
VAGVGLVVYVYEECLILYFSVWDVRANEATTAILGDNFRIVESTRTCMWYMGGGDAALQQNRDEIEKQTY